MPDQPHQAAAPGSEGDRLRTFCEPGAASDERQTSLHTHSALLQVHEEAPPDALGVAAALRAAEEALAPEGAPHAEAHAAWFAAFDEESGVWGWLLEQSL